MEWELQEAKAKLDQALSEPVPLESAGQLAERERQLKTLTDRVQSLATALLIQRTLASEAQYQRERAIARGSQKRLKNFGFRLVTLRLLGGLEIQVFCRYWCRSEACADKGKGCSLGLVLLGICDRCTPALASEVAQLAAALSSFEDAQARLKQMGIRMSIDKIASVSYHFSERARQRQLVEGMGVEGSLAGRPAGRGFDRWRPHPGAENQLIEFYLSQLDVTAADRVLFIADGAKWIWKRVASLWSRLGLKEEQCLELVDFYHVMQHLNTFAGLEKSWSRQRRKAWLTRQRRLLFLGKVDKFVAEIRQLSRGKRSKDWRRERDYLLRNAEMGRLNYCEVRRLGLPIGSGTMESAVRRVVNLRMKGAGIFWDEAHAEQMLLLRTYDKSKHWQVLEQKAFTVSLQLAV